MKSYHSSCLGLGTSTMRLFRRATWTETLNHLLVSSRETCGLDQCNKALHTHWWRAWLRCTICLAHGCLSHLCRRTESGLLGWMAVVGGGVALIRRKMGHSWWHWWAGLPFPLWGTARHQSSWKRLEEAFIVKEWKRRGSWYWYLMLIPSLYTGNQILKV